ncbi:short-chain dehydrogenases/reductase [Aspergillus heterothallicus]
MSNIEFNEIRGQLALVTGASGEIGAECAWRIAQKGVHLALTYSSNKQKLVDLMTLRISNHQVDFAKQHARPVDILVSKEGYGKMIQNILDILQEELNRMITINLTAGFLLAKGVFAGMQEQKWGRIVLVSSIAAYSAGLNGCHYAASKAGLIVVVKNLASCEAQYTITINDVAPAMVGSAGMLPDASGFPGLTQGIPLGRLCTLEEVANAVHMFVTTGFAMEQSLVVGSGLH